eukprot:5104327-Pyramimonas_sp.AAC.1
MGRHPPPTGVNLASSSRRRSAFGARWLPATGVDVGLPAGVMPPRRRASLRSGGSGECNRSATDGSSSQPRPKMSRNP